MASNSDKTTPRVLSYGSGVYRQFVEQITLEAAEKNGLRLLFAGPTDEQLQEALAYFGGQGGFNIRQIDLENLIGDHPMETQGNVREMFDGASEKAAVLVFNHGDAFFDQPDDMGAEKDQLTPVDYLFQRIESYQRIVILSLKDARNIARAREEAVLDVVVAFDS